MSMKRVSYFKSNPAIYLRLNRGYKSNPAIYLRIERVCIIKSNPAIYLLMIRASYFKSNFSTNVNFKSNPAIISSLFQV